MYKENPKTQGSGILCAIPQKTRCKQNCKDCFFQSGRSYLEPLEENLPNMPEPKSHNIVRVNDGNDSSDGYEKWNYALDRFNMCFLNTSRIDKIDTFKYPFVLTVNPGDMTDRDFHRVSPGNNLMFVRVRANTWNYNLIVKPAVYFYTQKAIPVVLTFMAYESSDDIPENHQKFYDQRKRTLNEYYAISRYTWKNYMGAFEDNKWVYSCSNEGLASACRFCGNCIREYHVTMERMSHDTK